MALPLDKLADAGVSIWLDDLSRVRLAGGGLADLMRDRHVTGVTTNPTIFAKAIAGSDAYAAQIQQLTLRQVDVDTALRELTAVDVRWAADVLRPAFDATGGLDGRVSIEVDARLAHDTDRTIAEARALWWLVDRPNMFVKIPATEKGLPAISACLAEGISINVTLIFSLARYADVVEAFLDGLERARAQGLDLSTIASVASLFVSRVDTEIDRRLDEIGSSDSAALRGEAGIANARLAYRHHMESRATDRWRALEQAGARPQRPLWASTGVKEPAYSDTRYVVELVAPGVVNTMPEATLEAVADHAVVPGDSITGTFEDAERVLARLAAAGIDYEDVMRVLEAQGVAKFDASWEEVSRELRGSLATRGRAAADDIERTPAGAR
jgi:transaldolase